MSHTPVGGPAGVPFDDRLAPIESVIRDVASGRMVVLVDDENRENEGDLVMAEQYVTPEAINFMIGQGRGLLCMPMREDRATELDLPFMVERNEDDFGTAFTVSLDARAPHGVSTGISAGDRARTITLAANGGRAYDFNRPGHVFPLVARPGGCLERPGHTEAAVDLAVLAGCEPVGVIIEIIDDAGRMMRLPELLPWARKHGLKVSSIELLREYLAACDSRTVA